jgi:hypothetical protein
MHMATRKPSRPKSTPRSQAKSGAAKAPRSKTPRVASKAQTDDGDDMPVGPRIPSPLEALPDGHLLLSFSIPKRPATKKTSQRIVRRGGFSRILPSIQYEEYEAHCTQYCEAAWKALGNAPMDFGVKIVLQAFMPSWGGMPDHCGILQSLGDILEKHGVLSNDKFIEWASPDSHWFTIDKANPRVEMSIFRRRHPYEGFRTDQEKATELKAARAAAKAQKAALGVPAAPQPPSPTSDPNAAPGGALGGVSASHGDALDAITADELFGHWEE